ncbi:Terribly reduced optic lobes [Operophtera brumata]|uniref:Terribly reduced optic lobes n=1 Tax=Operophtera brumata TaxID=104452 RepID=A0A0L7L1K9_OPEBR|nr:Terribly reduced optic lobes [Operophtera brumata]
MILLRADNNNAGLNITNFVMESAQHMNSGLGAASLVEECSCPEGYEGKTCEKCAPGFEGNPLVAGDRCRVRPTNNCNPIGTRHEQLLDECVCKENVQGQYCDQCKNGSFYLSNDFRSDGKEVPREHFLLALADVKTILIKATYSTDDIAKPLYASIETAESDGNGPAALHVEHCDPRGEAEPCDDDGSCTCKRHVEGENCDRCRTGTFGLDSVNPDGCTACFCSGATTDCQEANHYYRAAIPAPIFGDNYGGYTIMDINAETVINNQFVPVPDKSELILSLRQEFKSNVYNDESEQDGNDVILIGDDVSIAWKNPNTLQSGVSLSYQVPLRENGWTLLNTATAADRSDFMRVLKSLRRVLVKATLADNIVSTSIADVSMDTATEISQPNALVAKGVEICMCPPGHLGTSCETCAAGYYKNEQDYCLQCPCNGHDCQLDTNNQVVCNCRPPYTGRDCSAIGLLMELHPSLSNDYDAVFNQVTLTCKYRAPEPLTIKFVVEGQGYSPVKLANESTLHSDGWHGEHVMHTVWDTRQEGKIYECHTITQRGSTLGVLFTDMRHSALEGDLIIRPPNTRFESNQLAQSPYTRRLVMTWKKVDGNLPQGRTFIDQYSGLLRITNLQITDSGQYICQTDDGRSTGQAAVTLKVPANQMVIPSVEISPTVKEYYADDRIVLECVATGSPKPSISWQRASRRPLPMSSEHYDELFIIESAREEDSGEYRCIATNTVGAADRTAIITVRPRPARPTQDRLVVQPEAPIVNEGQSTRVVCTGSTNVPTGTIDWVREDGDRFQANVRSDNGVLYIDEATLENAGVYVCQTHGSEVNPEPILLTVVSTATPSPDQLPEVEVPVNVSQRGDSLIISEAEENDAGYYVCEGLDRNDRVVSTVYVYVEIETVEVWPPGEQPVALGNTQFEFHCRVMSGIPVPDVTWSRAGGRALSPHVEIKPNNILKFDKIEVNDEGEYICTGDNIVGSSSASAVIKVRSPPEIVITPTNYLEINAGDQINVDCRAEGYPEPLVTITGPDRREVSSQSRIASVRVPSASAGDDGEYACVATNSAGTIQDTFVIRVETRGDGGYDFGGSGDDIDLYPSNPNPADLNPPNSNPSYPYPSYPNNPYPEPRPNNPTRPVEQTAFEGQELNI